jgi:carbon storage regulator
MLVLKRKAGEFITLGHDIEVRILSIEGEQVRIGIVAPRSVTILRGELIEEVKNETEASVTPNAAAVLDLSKALARQPVSATKPRMPIRPKTPIFPPQNDIPPNLPSKQN